MTDSTLLWSAMGGMFMLFVGYVVWEQRQHAAHAARQSEMEKSTMETNLKTQRECDEKVNELRLETNEKIASIDKKQDVEFAKINTHLQQISEKLVEIQADLVKLKQRE